MEKKQQKGVIVFLKSELSSLSSTIVDLGVFSICSYWLKLNIQISTVAGIVVGGVVNYLMNRHFAFQETSGKQHQQLFRYLVVWVGSLLLNTYGTYLFYEKWKFDKLVTRASVGLIVRFLFNFPMLKYYVFKKTKENQ